MRVVAILAVHNEERTLGACLDHMDAQGVSAYVIDDGSTDATPEIIRAFAERGVVSGSERRTDGPTRRWQTLLRRKAELAAELDGDWFIHHDADEMRVAPDDGTTLARAIAEADDAGYNAVNFLEFTFVPTREAPDHDHPDFVRTMDRYYAFLPAFPHRLNAFKRQPDPVDLDSSNGHRVHFPGLRMSPKMLSMRHYLYLSKEQALRKYAPERLLQYEDQRPQWREELAPEHFLHPWRESLLPYLGDHMLDATRPRRRHPVEEEIVRARRRAGT